MANEQAQAATNPAPSPTAVTTPPAETQQDQWENSPEAYDATMAALAQLVKAPKTAPVTTEPTPVPPVEAQAQPEPTAPETPPETVTAETPVPPVEEAGILPERIRTSQFDPYTQRAIAHLKVLKQEIPDATLRDAMADLDRQEADAAAEEAAQAEERTQRTEAATAPVTARDTRIAELEGLLDAAAENETLFNKEIRANQRELESLKEQRRDDRARQERDADRQRQQAQQTLEQVKAQYPTASNPETPFGRLVDMTITDMKANGDPRWKGPKGPRNVVEEAVIRARLLGMSEESIAGRKAGEVPASPYQTPPALKPLVKPPTVVATGAAGPGAPAPPPKLSDYTERNLTSADELDSLFGAAASRLGSR